MTFGASRIDPAIGKEILRAVTPMAIEAAMEADRMHRDNLEERHRMVELDLQQARYEASLAERRYAACDPDNRLIAAQLEKSCEAALASSFPTKCRAREPPISVFSSLRVAAQMSMSPSSRSTGPTP